MRLRLVELELGAVNIVLMRSRFPGTKLGQIGFLADQAERDQALAEAAKRGLRVRDQGSRWLISTGQRFDVELTDPVRRSYGADARADLRLDRAEIACSQPQAAQELLAALITPEDRDRVSFTGGSRGYAELRSAVFQGRRKPASSLPL